MSLWICQDCTTAYSVDAPACPQCGSTDYRPDWEDEMPKISVIGGPTNAAADEPTGSDQTVDETTVGTVPAGGVDEPTGPDPVPVDEAPGPTEPAGPGRPDQPSSVDRIAAPDEAGADTVDAPDGGPAPEGTIAEVLDWVGDSRDRARRALDAEDKRDNPRTTLIEKLERIAAEGD